MIDEWSDDAKQWIQEALKEHLGSRYSFNIKFIPEDWLKTKHKRLWKDNESLFDSVAYSALLHAYPGVHTFPSKVKNFDYTLGQEFEELARVCEADGILFIRGLDYEATMGRQILNFWNFTIGMALGVIPLSTEPSFMVMGIVDHSTGDVEWFKTSPGDMQYSFKDKEQINSLVEWLTRDFLKTP